MFRAFLLLAACLFTTKPAAALDISAARESVLHAVRATAGEMSPKRQLALLYSLDVDYKTPEAPDTAFYREDILGAAELPDAAWVRKFAPNFARRVDGLGTKEELAAFTEELSGWIAKSEFPDPVLNPLIDAARRVRDQAPADLREKMLFTARLLEQGRSAELTAAAADIPVDARPASAAGELPTLAKLAPRAAAATLDSLAAVDAAKLSNNGLLLRDKAITQNVGSLIDALFKAPGPLAPGAATALADGWTLQRTGRDAYELSKDGRTWRIGLFSGGQGLRVDLGSARVLDFAIHTGDMMSGNRDFASKFLLVVNAALSASRK